MAVLDQVREEQSPEKTRPRGRWLLLGTLFLVGVAGTVLVLRDGSGGEAPAGPAVSTASVTRSDLSDRTEVDGTLGYAKSYTVAVGTQGKLTWLPEVGDVITRGRRVYGLDGHSVPLFYGSTPFWRDLSYGMDDGRDVLELERNLAALGYGDGMTVDDHFSSETRAAVKDWQDDLGVTESGTVAAGDAVVQPGPLRIKAVNAVPGGQAQGNLMTATGTTRLVTVKLPVNQQELAAKGGKVRIELPGDKSTTGRITEVGSVATSSATGGDARTGDGTESATIPVSITLDHPKDAGRLDGAPVTVGFTSRLHKAVLAVPVNALLANADGTYAVSVVDAAGLSHRVTVELGVFADGRVEVTGDLKEGAKVEVPRS
jgi:peptidoglycan hydrolase-like protein with peptidoglycan-binding domain